MHGKLVPPASRAPDIGAYLSESREKHPSRRLALWEVGDSMQCSIVGTCLSDQELLATIRKHKLQVDRSAQSYDVHSYCVRAASQCSPFSRSLTKLLDRKYEGPV